MILATEKTMKTMKTRTLLSFNYTNDIKNLEGFVKGGRDKVPKEFSDYQAKLISGWAEQTIKEHVESVATKAKDGLDISARAFQTPYYEAGTGGFDCSFFNYDFSVAQSEENFGECVFTGTLEIKNVEISDEEQAAIDECFEFEFDKATSVFPKGERDLKELIYSLDDNKKNLSATFEFSYENDFSAFRLVNKENGAIVKVDDLGVDIDFKDPEPISLMLGTLQEVNKNLILTAGETFLLSEG